MTEGVEKVGGGMEGKPNRGRRRVGGNGGKINGTRRWRREAMEGNLTGGGGGWLNLT